MSYPATQWAWKQPVQSAADRLVLLCLADHLNNGSKRLFPSVKTLAERTCLGQRTVSRSLSNLIASGHVQIVNRGCPGRANDYRLAMTTPATQAGNGGDHLPDSPHHLPHSHDHLPHSPNHLPVWHTNQEVTGNESGRNREAGTAALKSLKIGSPEVQAEARRRRPDLGPDAIAASTARFIERHGDGPQKLPTYLEWIDNTRGPGGVPAAQKRRDALLGLVPNIIQTSRRDGESEGDYLDRIEAMNDARLARLK